MDTSQIIATLRDERNMSQAELAKRLHIAPSTVGMWETGKRMPSPELIKQLAGLFDVSSDYILGITDKRHYYDLSDKEESDLAILAKKLLEGTTTEAEVNFDGEPMTDEAKANLHTAILTALEINKRNAKKKFTPKKYRGSESDKD